MVVKGDQIVSKDTKDLVKNPGHMSSLYYTQIQNVAVC
jgi:hypothetical protein